MLIHLVFVQNVLAAGLFQVQVQNPHVLGTCLAGGASGPGPEQW